MGTAKVPACISRGALGGCHALGCPVHDDAVAAVTNGVAHRLADYRAAVVALEVAAAAYADAAAAACGVRDAAAAYGAASTAATAAAAAYAAALEAAGGGGVSIKVPVPALDMDFRDYVVALAAGSGGEDYRYAAEKWLEERWVGSTTRSLQMHIRAREYCPADDAVFAHLRDVWEKWLRLREALLSDQYVYDP